ncbi:hypothetical protein [Streptomyces sp. NPDC059009]|uniref:hypothetical protein n=1 Tax=Streptomyces sp. NPDC059009 TaxID=3346694 RepID=UPI0036C15CAF
MSDALFRSLDVIEPGALVVYHGSIGSHHGLWLALPCLCLNCARADELGVPDCRFMLIDPWGELSGPHHVRRESITRSSACV